MAELTFVQFSDLHLDRPFSYLPEEKRRERRKELRELFRRIMRLARERQADLILIPGDLFEYDHVTTETISLLAAEMEAVAPIKVFIAPGNHDYFAKQSWYATGARDRLAKDMVQPWPENVYIFQEPRFSTFEFEAFTVTGLAHLGNHAIRPDLTTLRAPEDDRIHLLLIHGSRRGYLPTRKLETFPFSDEELLACGFDYTALGHYHDYAELVDAAGRIRAAYSGCPEGLGFGEWDDRYVIVGRISKATGLALLERVQLCHRRFRKVEIGCDGITYREDLQDQIRDQVIQMCRPEDLVQIRLTGRLSRAIDLDLDRDVSFLEQEGRVCYAEVRNLTEPDYDLESLRRERTTAQGAFTEAVMAEIEASTDPAQRALLQEALIYGLDALAGRPIRRLDRGDPEA